jgi:FkbM family methyltransferase
MEEFFLQDFQARAALGPKRVAIDVGASSGEWTRWMALLFSEVIAIEPDPRSLANLYRSGCPPTAHVWPVACGASMGRRQYHLRKDSRQSSLDATHPIGGADQCDAPVEATREVNVVTLDWVAEQAAIICDNQPIDFLKIDVEGSEADVLAGIQSPLFRRARMIIEVHDTAEAVGRELQRLGYDKLLTKRNPYPSAHPNHLWIFLPPLEQGGAEPEESLA